MTVWFAKTTIVGVVADFKANALDQKTLPEIFWSMRKINPPNAWIMTRTKAGSSILAEVLRQKIRQFDPDLPVMEMQSMSDVIADSMWLKRLSATLIGVVTGLPIMLAAAGI